MRLERQCNTYVRKTYMQSCNEFYVALEVHQFKTRWTKDLEDEEASTERRIYLVNST